MGNIKRIETTLKCFPHQHSSYWYQHDSNTAFKLSWFGTVFKYDGVNYSCFLLGHVTSKKQFVDVVYDYLNLKNTQS